MNEVVDLERQPGRRPVEVSSKLTRHSIQAIPDDGAIHIEPFPAHVGCNPIAQAVEPTASRAIEVFRVGRADDAKAPVEQRRDAECELAAIEQIVPDRSVGIEAFWDQPCPP